MSEKLRYLLTLDSKTGEMLKAEQLGEAGDLAEVDLAGFARSLASSLRVHGGLGAPSPVVINIFSGGAQDSSAKVTLPHDPTIISGWTTPPPTTPMVKPPKPPKPPKK